MKQKKAASMGFRPYQANRDRLEKAQALGFEMSEVMNGLIEKYLDSYVREAAQDKIRQMQKVLATR